MFFPSPPNIRMRTYQRAQCKTRSKASRPIVTAMVSATAAMESKVSETSSTQHKSPTQLPT